MDEFAHLFGRSDVVPLDRAVPDAASLEAHVGAFNEHVSGELRRLVEELDTPAIENERLGEHGALLRRTVLHRLEERGRVPVRELNLIVGAGCRVIGTPYDLDYSDGSAFGFGAKYDGKVTSIGTEGQAAGGIGFYLTSPTEVDVSITPAGEYEFSWFAAADAPGWRSFGGLGITIYSDGDPQPVSSRQVRLWDVRGAHLLQGGTGNGTIAGAASPVIPGGFGPVPLAPVIVRLQPGRRLLVWVWSWQVSNRVEGTIAFLSMRVPAVTICASPPLVIR
ncbi:hypothetical protein [Cellulomonas sp.]|uniref:hypothetical protein n=1 Tax=Cellulomonas sp. TaxID=40001 RepID=UPI003BACF200